MARQQSSSRSERDGPKRPQTSPELAVGLTQPERAQVATPRRVLVVASWPCFSIASTPLDVANRCRALTEIGYEIHLATLPLGRDLPMPGLIYNRVARIPGLSQMPVGFSFAKLAYDFLLAVKTFHLLGRQRFAAVHAIEDAAFFIAPIARWFGTPIVVDLDSDLCGQLLSNGSRIARALAVLARRLRRSALRRSSCTITVAGELTRLVHAESPGTRVFEIKDVPGEELMRPARPDAVERLHRELALPAGRLIVYTGNFDRRQGLETLIDAMPLVLKRHPDSVLLLIGGEPAQIERLRGRAARNRVGDAVRLLGKRPVDEMPEFMAMASVLVSPRLEPYVTPLKIYAYMASGRPIVATDLPAHTDVLDLNSAILAPLGADGLAEGIIRAFNEPARSARLGLRARQLVEREHTYEAFKGKLADVYAYLEGHARAVPSALSAE
jgi:glycosyltransferase involved in cell wall biosynthesis